MKALLDLVRATKAPSSAELREALARAEAERAEAVAALDRLQARRAELLLDADDRALDAIEREIAQAQRQADRLDLLAVQGQERLREAEEAERQAELDRLHAEGERALERGLRIYAKEWPKHAAALRDLAVELGELQDRVEAVNRELLAAGDPRRVAEVDLTARPHPPNQPLRGPALAQLLRLPSTLDSTKLFWPTLDAWGLPYGEREAPGR
jgi:hypothetical protein